jgi:hypothetical protein
MQLLVKDPWDQHEVENFRYSEPYSLEDQAVPPPVSQNYLGVWLEIALMATFLRVAALWNRAKKARQG